MATSLDVSGSRRPALQRHSSERTRRAILRAAQQLFATRGYAEAGVRDIAAKAGANSALIARYFGSKITLFETALEASLDVGVFTGLERERFGEALVQIFSQTRPASAFAVPMLIFAAGDTNARKSALRILKGHVIKPLEDWFGGPEAEERAAQLIAVVTGFYTYRLMLPLDPLKGKASPAMRRWLARTLQDIVDAPATGRG